MPIDRSAAVLDSTRRVRRTPRSVKPTAPALATAPNNDVDGPTPAVSNSPIAEVSYWPMLRSSMGAAALTLVAQCASAAWVALQSGHDVSLRRWIVVPYLQISTSSVAAFSTVVFWSSMITTVVLATFALSALVRSRSLQIQMGRSFAFLDISLMGVLSLTSAMWFERRQGLSNWMLNLSLGGAIAFAVAAWVVRDRHSERETNRAGQDQTPASS